MLSSWRRGADRYKSSWVKSGGQPTNPTTLIPQTYLIIQQHLAKIGARSLDMEIPGHNSRTLHSYSMRGHVTIFQTFNDGKRREIYAWLIDGNNVFVSGRVL